MTCTAVIVDDHAEFWAMARHLLEDADFEVVGDAVDGRGALDTVRAVRPRLGPLDVQLPDLGGSAVAEELSRTPDTPVVLTSARPAADYGLRRIAEASARGFVSKGKFSGTVVGELLGDIG